MRSEQDIRQVTNQFEEIAAEIAEGDLPLDRLLHGVTRAATAYRKFKEFFSDSELEVVELKIKKDGSVNERPFDWRALYDEGKPA